MALKIFANGRIRGTVAERLAYCIGEPTTSGCREWRRHRTYQGYGRIQTSTGPRFAHREMWIVHNGPIPKGLCVLHSCDNPPCCEITHLRLGTRKDNSDDKIKRRRYLISDHIRGVNNPNAKLTDDLVLQIISDPRSGNSLAPILGIDRSTITKIRSGDIWAHVTGLKK
jgi:hypothetical protein